VSELTGIPWDRKGVCLRAVVETPRGSRYKYAYEPETRALSVRFMLPRGLSWPYDYGFIPQTLCDDGDPADVVVILEEPTIPLATVRVRLVGGFEIYKDGERNDRLLACPVPADGIALRTDDITTIFEFADEELDQLQRFLTEYGEEQGHDVVCRSRYGPDDARDLVKQWHREWRNRR
jgi:inorganic pyrophosphatase